MKPLNKKELSELSRLHKKVMSGKASRREIERAVSLRARDNKTVK